MPPCVSVPGERGAKTGTGHSAHTARSHSCRTQVRGQQTTKSLSRASSALLEPGDDLCCSGWLGPVSHQSSCCHDIQHLWAALAARKHRLPSHWSSVQSIYLQHTVRMLDMRADCSHCDCMAHRAKHYLEPIHPAELAQYAFTMLKRLPIS